MDDPRIPDFHLYAKVITMDPVRRPSPIRPAGRRKAVAFLLRKGWFPVSDTTSTADLQQKYRQFLDLLPLTIALAGLPMSEGRLYGEEQIEARSITVRTAYRAARNLAKECLGGS
jgi:hypothetical protein